MVSNPNPEPPADRILLVCHAGSALGVGHLGRLLALAVALGGTERTSQRFLIQGERVVRDDLSGFDHSFIDLETNLLDAVIADCDEFGPGVVVFDLHPKLLPAGFVAHSAELRSRGIRVVGVDSLLQFCDSLDITWVPSLFVNGAELSRCAGTVHWGWDSFLISKRLATGEWSPGARVLVLTGGSDVTNQHATLPRLLDDRLPDRTRVGWVSGPFAGAPDLPKEPRLDWTVHEAPSGLDELISESDYAITVFGVTLFELLQYGIPTVVFSPYEDRELPELASVAAAEVAVVADGPDTAVAELGSLMSDDDRARMYSRAALERMADNGADRLAGLIHSLSE